MFLFGLSDLLTRHDLPVSLAGVLNLIPGPIISLPLANHSLRLVPVLKCFITVRSHVGSGEEYTGLPSSYTTIGRTVALSQLYTHSTPTLF